MRTAAVSMPPTTTRASGCWAWEPIPVKTAAGSSPTVAPNVAINMGRICCSPPFRIASFSGAPSCWSSMKLDTRRTPPNIATPNVEMIPTEAEILNAVPVGTSDSTSPEAKGTVARINKA